VTLKTAEINNFGRAKKINDSNVNNARISKLPPDKGGGLLESGRHCREERAHFFLELTGDSIAGFCLRI
jgi:hypothetical protein